MYRLENGHSSPKPHFWSLSKAKMNIGFLNFGDYIYKKKINLCYIVKDFLFQNTCYVRTGNLLKSRVSEICVKRIRVNEGVGERQLFTSGKYSFA